MVGTALADGWVSVGGWLGQRWLMAGAMLADGWGNVGGGWGTVG